MFKAESGRSGSRSFRLKKAFGSKKGDAEKDKASHGPKKLKVPAGAEALATAANASSDSVGVLPYIGNTIEVLTTLSERIAEFIIRNEPHEGPLSSGASTDTKEASLVAMNTDFEDIVAKADALAASLVHFADQDYARSDKQLNKTFQKLIDRERYEHFSRRLTRDLESSGVNLKVKLKPDPTISDALADWDEQIKHEHETGNELAQFTKFKYLLSVAFRHFTPFGA